VQSSSQIITTNKPTSRFFTGRMPFLSPNQQCQSTPINGFVNILFFVTSPFSESKFAQSIITTQDRKDARRRPGGIVLRMTWKVQACPKRISSLVINGDGELGGGEGQPANPGSPE